MIKNKPVKPKSLTLTKIALAMSILNGSLMPSVINAQEAADAEEDKGVALEVIEVTATRTQTLLQQTPVAVSAFSEEALQNRGITNMQQLESFVPSLSIGNRAGQGAGAGAINLRGIGVDGFGSDGAVGIYIDDVFYGAAFGNLLGMLDLQRVEVLRGPQGTVFGRNTLAGAIQYISAQPNTDELTGYIRGTVGNYDRQDLSLAINLPVSDSFAIRVSAVSQDIDGWVEDLNNNINLGASENQAARILATWYMTDDLTASFKYETIKSSNNGRATVVTDIDNNALFANIAFLFGARPFTEADIRRDRTTTPGLNDRDAFEFEMDILQATFSYDINEYMSFKSISSYQEYDFDHKADFDHSTSPIIFYNRSVAGDGTSVFSQEFRLEGNALDDKLRYTAGLFYYDEEVESGDSQLIGPLIPGVNEPVFSGLVIDKAESLAIFAQASYDLTEDLTLTVGARQTDEDVTAEQVEAPNVVPVVFKDNFTETSPYIGMDYQINDDIMTYVKYSEGFRAGGATANAGLEGGGVAFDPDIVKTYELGARMEFLNGRLRVNPTVFQTEWSDIQVQNVVVGAFGPIVTTSNIGDADINGLELETLFAAAEGLTLNFSLSLLDSEYTEIGPFFQATYPNGVSFGPFGPEGAVIVPNLSTDSDLQRAPELKYTIGGTYSTYLDGGAEIRSSLSYSYTDEQRSNAPDLGGILLDDYALLNARIQYVSADERWSVALFSNNLSDEKYNLGGTDYAAGYTVGVRAEDPARGREVGLELEFNF